MTLARHQNSLLREVTYWTLYLHSCVTVCSPEHHDKYHENKAYEHHQYVEMPPETKQRCTTNVNVNKYNTKVTILYAVCHLPEFNKEPRYWIGKHFPRVFDVSHDVFGPVHELAELVTWR